MAQTAPGNWYLGGSVGASSLKPRINNQSVGGNQDTRDTGMKLVGGYQFSHNWAVEAQFYDLGKWRYSDADITGNARVNGISVSAVGIYPLSSQMSLLGKLGVATQNAKVRATDTSTGERDSAKADATVPLVGFGLQYALNSSLALRAEYEYFGVPTLARSGNQKLKSHTALLSVGLLYQF